MQPSFTPPKTEEELYKRAGDMTIEAAHALKKTIEQRRAQAVRPFDEELKFYDAVIKIKSGEVVKWS